MKRHRSCYGAPGTELRHGYPAHRRAEFPIEQRVGAPQPLQVQGVGGHAQTAGNRGKPIPSLCRKEHIARIGRAPTGSTADKGQLTVPFEVQISILALDHGHEFSKLPIVPGGTAANEARLQAIGRETAGVSPGPAPKLHPVTGVPGGNGPTVPGLVASGLDTERVPAPPAKPPR
jgi:hypothetical protein